MTTGYKTDYARFDQEPSNARLEWLTKQSKLNNTYQICIQCEERKNLIRFRRWVKAPDIRWEKNRTAKDKSSDMKQVYNPYNPYSAKKRGVAQYKEDIFDVCNMCVDYPLCQVCKEYKSPSKLVKDSKKLCKRCNLKQHRPKRKAGKKVVNKTKSSPKRLCIIKHKDLSTNAASI